MQNVCVWRLAGRDVGVGMNGLFRSCRNWACLYKLDGATQLLYLSFPVGFLTGIWLNCRYGFHMPCWTGLRGRRRICKRIFLLKTKKNHVVQCCTLRLWFLGWRQWSQCDIYGIKTKAITCYFLHNSLFIIISQWPTQLVVIHSWSIFLRTPPSSNLQKGIIF